MKISVIGTGSWGTALAKVLGENNHDVFMWGRNHEVVDEINGSHKNHRYLPNVLLPKQIKATLSLEESLKEAEMIVLVIPTNAMRKIANELNEALANIQTKPVIVHATKGLEPQTHLRMSQVITECLSGDLYQGLVVLSGPSHAEEVARRDLTTVTAASESLEAAKRVQALFMNHYFRVYTNQDLVGVELGAALKNIIALGAGILVGLDYGDNAKAGLVTRGLAEISRLGIALGADPLTFLGLSGVGDLVVTCTSPHSRNWQAGRLLGQGKSREEVEQMIDMVVEGISTTHVAYELAEEMNIEMPITNAIYSVVFNGVQVEEAIGQLMKRDGKMEVSSDN